MRILLSTIAAAIGLAACASAPPAELLTGAYPADECRACPGWNAPQAPFKIFGNAYYVGTRGLSSILITSEEGHVLLDGGLPNTAPLILENIAALGFDIRDVRLILNSHAHYDHAGGIAALQRASGARVAASAPSVPVMERGNSGPEDPQFGLLFAFYPVSNVRAFADGETLAVGPTSLTGHLTPGHTRGGTTWSWRSCEGERCVNLVYADSQTPAAADGFRFSQNTVYPDVVQDFERGFATLERIPCDLLITPHPAASGFWERREAGFIDQEACRRYAANARAQLTQRLAAEAAAQP